ncbi:nicotinamide riboside transporter PnuC [Novosphingobium sp.]|uniref:nicotinamide riboside transporter PnuC n=1 Tax=Novosphingobium sp. TaxID=1874826 RepID=UPI0027375C32|nr:nicotinamide riboside transporter PnuC [Novosphingobium sp.]MDP3905858.1 nicotinamide riboside transporter PnuC [Novosphingobium sp.]
MGSGALIPAWTELAGAALGLLNIVLLVRRSVWNFPAAMAMVSLIGVTLFQARLYAETGLQVFFFVVNAWGWYLWIAARGANAGAAGNPDDRKVPVGWMTDRARFVWAAITAALSLSLGWLLHRFTNAALPFADSAIAGASVTAQILLSLRRIENWVLWIAIDVLAVMLYINRGLYFLAALYVVLGVMSVLGLREWRKVATR